MMCFICFQDPKPLPYLQDKEPYTFDIKLFVAVKGMAKLSGLQS